MSAATLAPSSMGGSGGNDLALKFLFANQDGVHVVLKFPKSALVGLVKSELVRNWPPGTKEVGK